ncbi:MAG: transglutaminase-like cysteine peptidase [Leptothrix sp. (in: b-proteobacteria)]
MLGLVLTWFAGSQAWDADRWLQSAARLGPQTLARARGLEATIAQAARMDDLERLVNINQFFNSRILFRSDIDTWGLPDYWASPLEMLNKGAGDCEDYAIGKYFSLLASGTSPAKLRMVYVRAMIGGPDGVPQAHMVLAYYPAPDAEPFILDNLVSEIRPASRRPDLTPVFSFNADGLWLGTNGAGAGDPSVRLSRWRQVLLKAHEQGFL